MKNRIRRQGYDIFDARPDLPGYVVVIAEGYTAPGSRGFESSPVQVSLAMAREWAKERFCTRPGAHRKYSGPRGRR